jgi:cytochrome c oxidase subunit 4
MTHDAAHHDPAAYDWSDPHHFHHDDAGHHVDHGAHHVTSWQRLFAILLALLFLTALTVATATAEKWAVDLGLHISHFWNVVIALSIALVKATMVCMYFMHLRHDNPLNTMVLLTTLFIFILFLLFTTIDLSERDAVNPFKADYVQAGGTGVGMVVGGGSLGGNITTVRRNQQINAYALERAAAKGREAPDEADRDYAAAKYWAKFYDYKAVHGKLPPRHTDDMDDHHARWRVAHLEAHGGPERSSAARSRPMRGVTPGLFDDLDPSGNAHGDH